MMPSLSLLLLLVAPSAAVAAAEQPLPPHLLRVSGSDAHPATATAATLFTLDPSAGCSFTWAHRRQPARGAVQSAYRVTVRDAATGGITHDSGRLNSSEPSHFLPSGRLASARGCVWTVAWWDGDGRLSAAANEAAFHIGPGAADWVGIPWIGSNTSNTYRATGLPATEQAAASVMLYICALGFGTH